MKAADLHYLRSLYDGAPRWTQWVLYDRTRRRLRRLMKRLFPHIPGPKSRRRKRGSKRLL